MVRHIRQTSSHVKAGRGHTSCGLYEISSIVERMQCKDPEDKIIAAVIDTLVDPKQVHRNVGMCAKAKLAQSKWLGKIQARC